MKQPEVLLPSATAPSSPLVLLPITQVGLDLPLRPAALERFRGAVAEQAGHADEWFHNHNNAPEAAGAYHYRYPLVQYHCRDGRAGLTGIGAGAAALSRWQAAYPGTLHMGGRLHTAAITAHTVEVVAVQATETWQDYRLHDWLALNDKLFGEWQRCTRMGDRMALLERALVAQVMAFARGIGWYVDRRLSAELIDYGGCTRQQIRGVELLAFQACFRIQARLPLGTGIGKGASIGFGGISAGPDTAPTRPR